MDASQTTPATPIAGVGGAEVSGGSVDFVAAAPLQLGAHNSAEPPTQSTRSSHKRKAENDSHHPDVHRPAKKQQQSNSYGSEGTFFTYSTPGLS